MHHPIVVKLTKTQIYLLFYKKIDITMVDSVILKVGSNFQIHIKDRYLEDFQWNCPHVDATRPYWQLVNTGSGNEPLSKTMLTQIFVAIWHH